MHGVEDSFTDRKLLSIFSGIRSAGPDVEGQAERRTRQIATVAWMACCAVPDRRRGKFRASKSARSSSRSRRPRSMRCRRPEAGQSPVILTMTKLNGCARPAAGEANRPLHCSFEDQMASGPGPAPPLAIKQPFERGAKPLPTAGSCLLIGCRNYLAAHNANAGWTRPFKPRYMHATINRRSSWLPCWRGN